jgi:hypothetical protein
MFQLPPASKAIGKGMTEGMFVFALASLVGSIFRADHDV